MVSEGFPIPFEATGALGGKEEPFPGSLGRGLVRVGAHGWANLMSGTCGALGTLGTLSRVALAEEGTLTGVSGNGGVGGSHGIEIYGDGAFACATAEYVAAGGTTIMGGLGFGAATVLGSCWARNGALNARSSCPPLPDIPFPKANGATGNGVWKSTCGPATGNVGGVTTNMGTAALIIGTPVWLEVAVDIVGGRTYTVGTAALADELLDCPTVAGKAVATGALVRCAMFSARPLRLKFLA